MSGEAPGVTYAVPEGPANGTSPPPLPPLPQKLLSPALPQLQVAPPSGTRPHQLLTITSAGSELFPTSPLLSPTAGPIPAFLAGGGAPPHTIRSDTGVSATSGDRVEDMQRQRHDLVEHDWLQGGSGEEGEEGEEEEDDEDIWENPPELRIDNRKGMLTTWIQKKVAREDDERHVTEKQRNATQKIHGLLYELPAFAPDWGPRRWWDVLMMWLILYHIVVGSLTLCLGITPTPWILSVEGPVSTLLVIDVAINCNTAVQERSRDFTLLVNRRDIMWHYFTSGDMALDLLGGLPFDLVTWYIFKSEPVWWTFRSLRFLKIFKLRRLLNMTERGTMDAAYVRFYFWITPLLWLFWKMLVCGHILTLCRILVSPETDPADGCSEYGQDACSKDPATQYFYAFFWVWALLTGQGLTATENQAVFAYAAFVLAVGLFMQGHIVATMSAMMLKSNVEEQNRDSMRTTLALLVHYNIPRTLQQEVLSFQFHSLQQNAAAGSLGYALAGLPEGMKREVGLYIKVDLVEKVPMFKDLSSMCLMDLANCLQESFAEPDDLLTRYGDEGHEMYFLMHGYADIIIFPPDVGPEGVVVSTLTRGDFFGEVALLRPGTARTANIQALTYCDLFCLRYEDFERLLSTYSDLEKCMTEEADRRGLDPRVQVKSASDPRGSQVVSEEGGESVLSPRSPLSEAAHTPVAPLPEREKTDTAQPTMEHSPVTPASPMDSPSVRLRSNQKDKPQRFGGLSPRVSIASTAARVTVPSTPVAGMRTQRHTRMAGDPSSSEGLARQMNSFRGGPPLGSSKVRGSMFMRRNTRASCVSIATLNDSDGSGPLSTSHKAAHGSGVTMEPPNFARDVTLAEATLAKDRGQLLRIMRVGARIQGSQTGWKHLRQSVSMKSALDSVQRSKGMPGIGRPGAGPALGNINPGSIPELTTSGQFDEQQPREGTNASVPASGGGVAALMPGLAALRRKKSPSSGSLAAGARSAAGAPAAAGGRRRSPQQTPQQPAEDAPAMAMVLGEPMPEDAEAEARQASRRSTPQPPSPEKPPYEQRSSPHQQPLPASVNEYHRAVLQSSGPQRDSPPAPAHEQQRRSPVQPSGPSMAEFREQFERFATKVESALQGLRTDLSGLSRDLVTRDALMLRRLHLLEERTRTEIQRHQCTAAAGAARQHRLSTVSVAPSAHAPAADAGLFDFPSTSSFRFAPPGRRPGSVYSTAGGGAAPVPVPHFKQLQGQAAGGLGVPGSAFGGRRPSGLPGGRRGSTLPPGGGGAGGRRASNMPGMPGSRSTLGVAAEPTRRTSTVGFAPLPPAVDPADSAATGTGQRRWKKAAGFMGMLRQR